MSDTASIPACDRTERIEQIFQRVEEESERRAQAQADADAAADERAPADAARLNRERRRGSVSVSRFGQTTGTDGPASAEISPVSSFVTRKPTFYSAQTHTTSADSLASTPSDSAHLHPGADQEEPSVVQMETIAGKQSLSKALTARLNKARTRSRDVLSGNASTASSIVITEATVSVAVEVQTHEEVHHDWDGEDAGEGGDEEESASGRSRATSVAYAEAAGKDGKDGKEREKAGWLEKAKGMTHKLKRKSMATLGQAPR